MIESYCGFGVMELERAGCDGELQIDGFTGELLRAGCDKESYARRAGCDREKLRNGCDEKQGVMESY